jgi:hypothetical protein
MGGYFSENVEVRGYVKPGVSTDILVETVANEINSLTKKDAIILWGGANNAANNNSKADLRNISHFVKNNSHTNFVLMGVPHRFDLPDTSCVNKEVGSFNNKLMKTVKPFITATLLKFEQKREHFTRHGMHLNAAILLVQTIVGIYLRRVVHASLFIVVLSFVGTDMKKFSDDQDIEACAIRFKQFL